MPQRKQRNLVYLMKREESPEESPTESLPVVWNHLTIRPRSLTVIISLSRPAPRICPRLTHPSLLLNDLQLVKTG